jgi:hypothetical protein
MNYVYLDEITPTGVKVQSVMIGGTNGVGLQVGGGFGIPGSVATTDADGTKHGQLYRSSDGLFVHIAGYNAAQGTTSITSAVPRILARLGNDPITQSGHYDVTTTKPTTTTNTYWGHFGDNAGTKNLWAIGSLTTVNTGRLEYWNWGSAQTTVPTTTISLAGVVAADYFGSTIYVARESTNNICTMTNTGTTMNSGLTTGTTCSAIAASASTTNIRAIAVVSASEIWVASYGTGPVKITGTKTTITCSTSCANVIGMTLNDDRKKLYFTTKTGFYSLTVATSTVDNEGNPWYTIPEVNKEFRGISLAPVRNGISPSTASIASTSLVASYIEDSTLTKAQRMWLSEFNTAGVLLSNRFVVPGTAPSIVGLYPAQINHGSLTRSRDNTALVMTGSGVAIGTTQVAQGTSHAKAVARMTCAGTTTYGPTWTDVNIVTGATAVTGTGTTVVHASSQGGMHYFSASTATTVTASYTTMSFTKPMYSLSSTGTYQFFAFRRLAAGQHQYWATAPTAATAPTGNTGATGVTTIGNLGSSYVIYPTTGIRKIAWVETTAGLRMNSATSTTFSTTVPTATFPTGDNNLVDVTITDDGTTVYAVTKNGLYSIPFGGTTWTLVAYPLAPGLSDYRGISMAPTGC